MGKLNETHNFLNEIFIRAKKDYEYIKTKVEKCEIQYIRGNYLEIDEEYEFQHYPIPIIEIEKLGDIGYNLDKIFFEFSIAKEDFNNVKLDSILKNFSQVEIYGGEDCSIDFYKKGGDISIIQEKVESSFENIIMLSVYLPYDCYELDKFFEVRKYIEGVI